MKQENFNYLKEQVKFSGFGDAMEFKLKEKMIEGLTDFQLHHKHTFGKDNVEAVLNFRKSDQDNYFFNSYQVTVNKEGADPLKQLYKLYKPDKLVKQVEGKDDTVEWVNHNIKLKEAYNLLEGRSVRKEYVRDETEKYANWLMIDFKNTDKDGNFLIKRKMDFDLEAKLKEYPIKELKNEESKKELLDSLYKGNRQFVTMDIDGKERKFAFEANAQFSSVNRYEGDTRIKSGEKATPDQSAKQNESQKADQAEDKPRQSKRNAQKNKRGITS